MGLSEVGRRKKDVAFVKYELTEVRRLVKEVVSLTRKSFHEGAMVPKGSTPLGIVSSLKV